MCSYLMGKAENFFCVSIGLILTASRVVRSDATLGREGLRSSAGLSERTRLLALQRG